MLRRSTHAGFTLIELVITITITALGAVLVFNSFSSVLKYSHKPTELLQAEFLARELAEEALAAGYGNVTTPISDQAIDGFTNFTRGRTAPTAVAAGSGGCPSVGATCQQVVITVSVSSEIAARQTVLLMQ